MPDSTFRPRKQANQIQPVESDFKLLQFLLSRNKWSLLLFIVGGLTIGLVYYRLMPERYLISSTLLIKEENQNPELKNVFRQLNTQKKTSDIEDQIGLLKSYRLNLLTLEEFDWSYRWSQDSWLKTMDLFPEEPFRLSHFEGSSQVSGIPLEITALSDSTYRIRCTKTIKHLSKKQHISYNQVVKFGKPFINSHFHFTLWKKSTANTENGKTYFLEFMDRSEAANFYKENVLAVRFNPIAESNLISLKLETLSPQRDVLYLNKLMDVFLQYGIDEKNKAAENTIRFIDEQISGVNESLESAGATFTNFRTSNRTVNLDLEASAIIERQNQIEAELMQLDNRLDYYHDLKYYLENKGENNNLIAPNLTTFTDDFLKANVERVNELFSRRQVLSLTAKEKNPTLISLDNEIRFTQKMLLENKPQVLHSLVSHNLQLNCKLQKFRLI